MFTLLVGKLGKRIFDIVMGLMLSIIFSPLIALVALVILVFEGSPLLFKQNRSGLNNKVFCFYKFKTMNNNGNHLGDENRLTPLGKFLRKTSLDELPSFLNVLKGIAFPRCSIISQYF